MLFVVVVGRQTGLFFELGMGQDFVFDFVFILITLFAAVVIEPLLVI